MSKKFKIKDNKTKAEMLVPIYSYKDFSTAYSFQKKMMGILYHKRFKLDKKQSEKRIRAIMRAILIEADKDILLGAKVDYGPFEICMHKSKVDTITRTVKNGFLHAPFLKLKNFVRLKLYSYRVIASMRYQYEIAEMMKKNIYDNITV